MTSTRLRSGALVALALLAFAGAASAECVPGTTVHGKCTQAPPPPPPPPPHR